MKCKTAANEVKFPKNNNIKSVNVTYNDPCFNFLKAQYIDLARAKSEALVNIYSLLHENIKSCDTKQTKETVKTTRTVKQQQQ